VFGFAGATAIMYGSFHYAARGGRFKQPGDAGSQG